MSKFISLKRKLYKLKWHIHQIDMYGRLKLHNVEKILKLRMSNKYYKVSSNQLPFR